MIRARSLAAAVVAATATLLSGPAAPARSAAPPWTFTARVAGIPVADSAGRQMPAPFLGGFDVPRPQLVDITGDGKPDLFVQERSGALIYFERVGDDWVWRSDHFQNLDVGEWYRFVDVDGDGAMDLFAEMLTGYARVWRNAGTKTAPKLVALGDTIRDMDGRALVVDRQNILNAVDIDCNGKLDLFIGRVQGVVDRYEQEGHSPDGAPRFRLADESWQGIEVIGPEAGGMFPIDTGGARDRGPAALHERAAARLHGANTLAFADVYGRGVLDLFWGDFFEEGLLRFENTGTCSQPNLRGKPARFPAGAPLRTSGYNAATFGDVNGDGTVDLVMGVIGGAFGPSRTSVDNLYLVTQAPKGTWTLQTKRLISTIDVGSDAAPALADLTGDGLFDLVIGSKVSPSDATTGTVTWFENVGTASAPAFKDRGALPIRGQFNYTPAVADLDGDGLPDIIAGTWSDRVQWYRNTGTARAPSFTLADSALVTITRGTNTTPTVGDLDGDGRLDLVIGEASGTINVYRNVGSATAPKFELVSDTFQGIKAGRRSAPLLVKMTDGGSLDLLIGTDDGRLQLWRRARDAAPTELRFERDSTFVLSGDGNAVPAAGDLRHSGTVDLFVGTSAGGLRWFESSSPAR